MIKALNIFRFSYAREWHEKLRELKESRAGLSLTVKSGPRSPGGGAVGGLQALVPSQTKRYRLDHKDFGARVLAHLLSLKREWRTLMFDITTL